MFDNFINGIKNGFRVANATRKIVFKDKGLFIYPVTSAVVGIVAAILIIAVLIGFYLIGIISGSGATVIISIIIMLFVLYFAVFFISTYFTMAMLIAFREFANGKRISMGEALGRTSQYSMLIVKWALFYTIIATIINIIEGIISAALSRYGIGGRIISGIITGGANIALAAAVAFALPVILDEKKGPIDTIKASTSFIMKNFGDTFGGLVFTEVISIVALLIGLALIFIGIISGIAVISIILAVLGFLVIIAGVLLRYVLFNCFKLIVYDYKTRKTLPKGFDAKLIDGSIKRKRKPQGGSGINPVGFFGTGQQGNV
ncbi:MAG: hypothetical protein ACREBH_01835 [Candidatus Micrarchaeaceae archaeon]